MAFAAREAALRARIAEDAWDVSAWEGLVALAAEGGSLDKQREAFEAILTQFPTAAKYWQKYAELELDESEITRAKQVFSRCLLTCPTVKLWSMYLRFIKKMNETKGVESLSELRRSYEYTLDRIGVDPSSGVIWQEYIAFLQSPRAGTPPYQALFGGAHAGQEETQRTLLLRRAFHKALTVPGKHLEQMWRAYEEFERSSSINPQLARKELDEQRPRYHAAKSALAERNKQTANLNIYALATPPEKGGWEQQEQARLWKQYIAWEKSNVQMLAGPTVAQRVSLAYEQATMPLLQYPEIWQSHARWHATEGGGGPTAAAQVLGKARAALPDCALLHFAAADLEESRGDIEAARGLYEELIGELPTTMEAVSTSGADAETTGFPHELSHRGTLLWTQYLRFSRRVDGVAASRKVFLRARRWPGISWQIFVAAAKMEYASDGNDRVARNLFELGLEQFISIPGYVLQYVSFLEGLADIHNVRALFERALGETAPSEAGPLWDRYIQFESCYSSLASVSSLEQRKAETAPEPNEEARYALLKYRWLDLWPCSYHQEQHLKRLIGELPALQRPEQPQAVATSRQPVASAAPQQQQLQQPIAGGIAQQGSDLVDQQAGPSQGIPAVSQPNNTSAAPVANPGAMPAGNHVQATNQAPEPIKQMPPELGLFLGSLPSARGFEPPYASVDAVVDILMKTDLSPQGIAAAEEAYRESLRGPPRRPKFSQSHAKANGIDQQRPDTHAQGWAPNVKRERDKEADPDAAEGPMQTEMFDPYRARAKQRLRRGA